MRAGALCGVGGRGRKAGGGWGEREGGKGEKEGKEEKGKKAKENRPAEPSGFIYRLTFSGRGAKLFYT